MTHATNNTAKMGMQSFLFGAIIGGIVTALFTPRKGDEVRHMIKDKAHSMKKGAESMQDKAKSMTEENELMDDVDRAFK
jgi:gas vesicle protein